MSEAPITGEDAAPALEQPILYTIGIEFYKNESEKEMDGHSIVHFHLPAEMSFDDVVQNLSDNIKEAREAANKNVNDGFVTLLGSDTKSALEDLLGHALTESECFVLLLIQKPFSLPHFQKIVSTVDADMYWFHLFNRSEMAKQRKTMFEKTEAESNADHFSEPSLEDSNMDAKDAPPNLDNGGLTFTKDAFISKSGEILNGLPDFWTIKAGLI